jgi:hypothetical protein
MLELQQAENTVIASSGDSTFNLVNTLLTEVLVEDDEQLAITASPDDFMYDTTTGVEVVYPAHFFIGSADIKETGLRTEITMAGTVENRTDKRFLFNLYFIMKRTIPVIPRETRCVIGLTGKYLLFHDSRTPGKFYDALFDITLKRVDRKRSRQGFSVGRGYLFFSRDVTHEEDCRNGTKRKSSRPGS